MPAASLSLGAHTRAVASRAFLRPIGGAEPVEQRADRSACSLPVHHEAWRCAEQPAVLLGGGVSEKLEGARLWELGAVVSTGMHARRSFEGTCLGGLPPRRVRLRQAQRHLMVMKVRARDSEAAPIAVLEAPIHVACQRGGCVGLLAARALDSPVAALGREVSRAVAQSERRGAAERAVRAAHHERLDPARELEVDLWVLVGRKRPAVDWTALGQATVALRLQPEGDALPAKGVPRGAARQPARREHQAEADWAAEVVVVAQELRRRLDGGGEERRGQERRCHVCDDVAHAKDTGEGAASKLQRPARRPPDRRPLCEFRSTSTSSHTSTQNVRRSAAPTNTEDSRAWATPHCC